MVTLLQVLLALISWFFVVIAPLGPLGFANRSLPPTQKHGVSIFPGWPLLPLLFLSPMPFLGAAHLVMRVIMWFHAAILIWALAYLSYWIVRTRRAG
jgi:hypothetical protein